jgi:hypothetical protein
MTGLLRTAALLLAPYGGQRGSRANALRALDQVRAEHAAQVAASAAFTSRAGEPPRHVANR